MKDWDAFKKPAAGATGAPCGFPGAGTDTPGTRPACTAPTPAAGETAKAACCAAAVPFKVDAELKFELLTEGRTEVCIIGNPATAWEPKQFVQLLDTKYSLACIEGAMKMAAGAAAAVGTMFMM